MADNNVNEMKLAKFEAFIDNIKAQINYYIEPIEFEGLYYCWGGRFASIESKSNKSQIVATGIIPFVFNAIELNGYSDIINQKFTAEIRSKISRNGVSFDFDVPEDIKERISKLRILLGQVKRQHSYSIAFIFTLFMSLAVDKAEYEKRISTVCDVAVMLEVTDDEIADIVQVVRYVYRDIKANEVNLKTDSCKDTFSKVIK